MNPYDENILTDPWVNSGNRPPMARYVGGPFFNPAIAAIGGTATLVGGGLAAGLMRKAHFNAMAGSPKYAEWNNKALDSDLFKTTTSPLETAKFLYAPHIRPANKIDSMLYPKKIYSAVDDYEAFSKVNKHAAFKYTTKIPKTDKIVTSYGAYKAASKAGNTIVGANQGMLTMPWLSLAMGISDISNSVASDGFRELDHAGKAVVGQNVGMLIGQGLGFAAMAALTGGTGAVLMAAGAIGGGMLGAAAGGSIPDMIRGLAYKGRQWTTPDFGGSFRDNAASMTMRQRSLNMIQTSQFNIRSNLGREAINLRMGY